jgi:glycosyltransferase involved in cell wall biosynthesis
MPVRAADTPTPNRMTLLQVTPTSYTVNGVIGGGERLALYVDEAIRQAAAARNLALDTILLSLDSTDPVGQGLDRYQSIPGRAWQPGSVAAQSLIARLEHADIVYVHQCMTEIGLYAAAHARLLGKPVYGSDAGAGEASLLRHDPDAMVVYDAVHAISEFAAAAFQGMPVPVHVVPGPVDTGVYRPDPATEAERDRNLVVALGRVLPHKGYERTIRALPDGMRLVIVGQHYDTEYFDFLRGCVGGKDVRFEERLDDAQVLDLLRSAGIMVHASSHRGYRNQFYHKPELLGLAPLEAIACGLTTLVSDAGALPELEVLPGCHVFRSDVALAALLQDWRDGRLTTQSPAAMHAAVTQRYGLLTVGGSLLDMMKVAAPCGS